MSLVSGARVKVYINNRFIGEVTDFRYAVSTQKKAVYGIDATEPFEFAPGITVVRGSVSLLRPAGLGSLEGYGIKEAIQEAMLEKYCQIILFDRASSAPVFQTDRAVITNQSWQVATKGLMTGSFEFEAFNYINEAGFILGWQA